MAEIINIPDKLAGEDLTAGEFNQIKNKTNAAITEQNETKTSHAASISANAAAIAGKVGKVTGKGLSTNDYTTEEKNKLNNMTAETGATIKSKLEALTGNERLDASAVKGLPAGGGGNAIIVEWVEGEMPPTIDADYQIGNFIQGRKHLVTITAVGDETVAIIQAENFAEGFDTITLGEKLIIQIEIDNTHSFLIILSRFRIEGQVQSYTISKYSMSGVQDPLFDLHFIASDQISEFIIDSNNDIVIAGSFAQKLEKYSIAGVKYESYPASDISSQSIMGLVKNTTGLYAGCFNMEVQSIIKLDNAGLIDSSYDVVTDDVPIIADELNRLYVINYDTPILKRLNSDGSIDLNFTPYSGVSFLIQKPVWVNSKDHLIYVLSGIERSIVCLNEADGSVSENFIWPTTNCISLIYASDKLIVANYFEGFTYANIINPITGSAESFEMIPFDENPRPLFAIAGDDMYFANRGVINKMTETGLIRSGYNRFSIANALPTSANFGDILVCVGNMKWNTIPAPTTQSYLMHSGVEESLPFWYSAVD